MYFRTAGRQWGHDRPAGRISAQARRRSARRSRCPRDRPARERRASRFVIQQHHARSLHWDVRLERDGVLVSFAVPRGLPRDRGRNNLAKHTEDHPLEYLDFPARSRPASTAAAG